MQLAGNKNIPGNQIYIFTHTCMHVYVYMCGVCTCAHAQCSEGPRDMHDLA